jgi:hypothetical protein
MLLIDLVSYYFLSFWYTRPNSDSRELIIDGGDNMLTIDKIDYDKIMRGRRIFSTGAFWQLT